MANKKKTKEKSDLEVGMDIYTRIMLGNLFPERCSIEEYLLFDDIKKKIEISEEETKEINFQISPDGKTSTWNRKGNENKPFFFTPKEAKTILNTCELASRNKNFPNNTRFFAFYKEIKNFVDSQKEEK